MLKRILLGLLVLGILALPLRAQFVSGSTGVDGAFNPTMSTALNCPANDCVFNYTTVNIPNGVTISYRPNAFNTPVTILAQGDVTIAGTITVSGSKGGAGSAGATGGAGGPGGFRGGDGGRPGRDTSDLAGMIGGAGLGPGGGPTSLSAGCDLSSGPGSFASRLLGSASYIGGGPTYGTPDLLPLIGGSGGAGGSCSNSNFTCGFGSGQRAPGGGGGGGAILIASSTTISITGNGKVTADGGQGGDYFGCDPPCGICGGPGCRGHGGSGGAIRLVANTITGNGSLSAIGGWNSGIGDCRLAYRGGDGRIRLESGTAIPSTLSSSPGAAVNVFPPAVPPSVVLPGLPSLRITAVGGQGVPNPPTGQFGPTDVTLTAPGTSTVELAASGIPLGTTIQVTVKPEVSTMPPTTYTSTPLSGALESSTATANVNFPALNSYFVEARATYTPPGAGAGETMNINGEKIKQIRVETAQGAGSKLTYILESGKELPSEKAPLAFNVEKARGKTTE